jgi:CO/xanthine dehydrogenase Mo-binding subunit
MTNQAITAFWHIWSKSKLTSGTGQVRLTRADMVADMGTIINPVAHQAQVDGGFMHGFGFAIIEELVINDGKVATLSLGDYEIPTQADMPRLRTVPLPTATGRGPFGAKSARELTSADAAQYPR